MAGPWENYGQAEGQDIPADGPWSNYGRAQTSGGRFAQPGVAPKPSRSWGDVPIEALTNVVPSAVEFGKSVVQPIMHPVETAKAFRDIGAGLVSKAKGLVFDENDPEAKAKREAAVDALGAHLAQRYGSIEGLKKTMAEDPVGFLADASLILTGGGAAVARAPGVAGKVGQIAGSVGAAVDPISIAAKAPAAAGRAAAEAIGVTSGTGSLPYTTTFQARREGNPTAARHMRDRGDISEVIDLGESAVRQMGNDRRAAYQSGTAAMKADQTALNMQPVEKVLQSTAADLHFRGILKDPKAAAAHSDLTAKINEFMTLPAQYQTAEAFDALKQAVGAIREGTEQGSGARRVVDQVYNAVKGEIVRQVPSYAKAMEDYGKASDRINEARRTLSINDKATEDTTLRKLQSAMRNNVNTNYGARTKLADELGQYEPNLMPALAGQALNSWAPRGIARAMAPALGGAAGAGAVMMNPVTLATLPLMSPRLMGEAANALGAGARLVDTVASPIASGAAAVGLTPERAAQAALLSYLAGETAQAAEPSLLDLFR